jgi:hypothetical protein
LEQNWKGDSLLLDGKYFFAFSLLILKTDGT